MSCFSELAHPLLLQQHCTYLEFHCTGNPGTACCFQRTEKSLDCAPRSNGCGTGYPPHYTGSTLTTLTSHLKSKIRKTHGQYHQEGKGSLVENKLLPCWRVSRSSPGPHTCNPVIFSGFNYVNTNTSAGITAYLSDWSFLNTDWTDPWWSTAQCRVVSIAPISTLWLKMYKELDGAILHQDLQILGCLPGIPQAASTNYSSYKAFAKVPKGRSQPVLDQKYKKVIQNQHRSEP